MVDMTAITSFVGGLQAASGIARTLMGLKITGEVQAKVIELQSVIMSAQSDALTAQQSQFELLARVRELEEIIAGLERMGGERERYELTAVDRGAFAYTLKPEVDTTEPPHWLCVPCFEGGHKSLLQNWGPSRDKQYAEYGCARCQTKITTHWRNRPSPPKPREEGAGAVDMG